ncbi:MAG TPA: hypothetical protein VMW16_05310 [Sedimentisphaerales bacterium]|nr:hypothetical protein [Sedimentisphaerales bacterium]
MKKTVFAIFVVLIATGAGVCLLLYKARPPAEEGRCSLKSKAVNTLESTIYFASQDGRRISEKPAELKGLPGAASKDHAYFIVRTPDVNIPVVLDSYRNMKRSALYMDTDGDGYLSDEKGFRAKPVRRGEWFGPVDYYRFGPVTVQLGQVKNRLTKKLYVISRKGFHGEELCFCPADYRRGRVRLGKTVYNVAVVDGNFDAKYGKIFVPPAEKIWRPGCDSFAIDLNGNKKFDWDLYRPSELMPLARMVKLKDSYYEIDIAADGSSLQLNKCQPEFGTLDLAAGAVRLKLWSDAAEQFLSEPRTTWQLPAGKYQATFLEFDYRTSKQEFWTFTSYIRTGALRDFEIRPGESALLKIGPPLTIKTNVTRSGSEVHIAFNLQGQAGEQYNACVLKNGEPLLPPRFRIVDEAGKVLHSGQFEYG